MLDTNPHIDSNLPPESIIEISDAKTSISKRNWKLHGIALPDLPARDGIPSPPISKFNSLEIEDAKNRGSMDGGIIGNQTNFPAHILAASFRKEPEIILETIAQDKEEVVGESRRLSIVVKANRNASNNSTITLSTGELIVFSAIVSNESEPPYSLKNFKNFLVKNHAQENILFIQEVHRYELLALKSLKGCTELEDLNTRIYKVYLDEGAELEINIMFHSKIKLKNEKESMHVGKFADAYAQISTMLMQNYFQKFVTSLEKESCSDQQRRAKVVASNSTIALPTGELIAFSDIIMNQSEPPYSLNNFKTFLEKNHAQENILFLEEVNRYVQHASKSQPGNLELCELNTRIYMFYLDEDAEFEINILYQSKVNLKNERESVNATKFDDAFAQISKMLMQNYFKKFVASADPSRSDNDSLKAPSLMGSRNKDGVRYGQASSIQGSRNMDEGLSVRGSRHLDEILSLRGSSRQTSKNRDDMQPAEAIRQAAIKNFDVSNRSASNSKNRDFVENSGKNNDHSSNRSISKDREIVESLGGGSATSSSKSLCRSQTLKPADSMKDLAGPQKKSAGGVGTWIASLRGAK